MEIAPYFVIEKEVGETPLQALERGRNMHGVSAETPLTYAGRLDPMASGRLLILVGDTCKKKEAYLGLDKEYVVEVLLGASSDTGDVLGCINFQTTIPEKVTAALAKRALRACRGAIRLPYPHFSSKTVQGKPLHTWTLEGRVHEIAIPIKQSHIYKITYNGLRTVAREEIVRTVDAKIATIPEVTDPRKALGADFRRDAVRAGWQTFAKDGAPDYQVLTFTCICSSGTYMRSLAEYLGKELGMAALAYSIHRTKIGRFQGLFDGLGVWTKRL